MKEEQGLLLFFIESFGHIMPCFFGLTPEEELVPKAVLYIFFSTLQADLIKPMSNNFFF